MISLDACRANETFDHIKADHVSELAVMKANLKKKTLQVDSLEKTLLQKVIENLVSYFYVCLMCCRNKRRLNLLLFVMNL